MVREPLPAALLRIVELIKQMKSAALLAESLVESAGGDDDGRLGVMLADLVATMVALGPGEVGLAALGLAPRRVVAVGVAASRREVGPVAEVEPELRGSEAGHVLLRRADQCRGEVVLRSLLLLLLVVGLEAAVVAEVGAAVRAGVAGEVVVGGGLVVVELEDVVGAVGGDGSVAGRGEEGEGVGFEVVAEVVVLPVDALLVIHDREERRRRRVGSSIPAELVPGCSRQVHHPFIRGCAGENTAGKGLGMEQRTRGKDSECLLRPGVLGHGVEELERGMEFVQGQRCAMGGVI